MTERERLAEIKATLHYWDALYAAHGLAPLPPAVAAQESARHVNRAQIDWLIDQADLAFELGDLLPKKQLAIDRLRGLLKRLEHDSLVCPVCEAVLDLGERHGKDADGNPCWLAAEVAPPRPG